MLTRLLILAALLALPIDEVWATAQAPERILINGQVLTMYSTPLAPLLERREDLDDVFRFSSTACHRGYVGTWHVEGDRLFLISLSRSTYDRKLNKGRGGEVEERIPLSVLFSTNDGPIAATWFSGTLRVPKGFVRRSVHMGFGSTFDRELHLEIVRGRVVSQRIANQIHENRGRSGKDIRWVALASATHVVSPPPDDGQWIDARTIDEPGFRSSAGKGKPFTTRGVLDKYEDGSPMLWIPPSLVTDARWIPLQGISPWPMKRVWPHVELEGIWTEESGSQALQVCWLRMLHPGETIHHRAYPVREFTDEERRRQGKRGPPDDPNDPMGARTFDMLSRRGWSRLRGTLKTTNGVSQVKGVDVHADATFEGKTVIVTGAYEKWIITARLLALDIEAMRPFRSRGPGTYRRLVDPKTGLLAKPRWFDSPKTDKKDQAKGE